MKQTIVLAVCGGIAAYKSAALCSLLVKTGYDVQVLMTSSATRFIQPLTFQALSKKPVLVDTFEEPNPGEIAHIAMADRADLFLVAPATANMVGKLANGIADDMVASTALAVTCPVVIAPAMNVHMYEHLAVQANLQTLQDRGAILLDPGSGPLACGYTGKGRLPEPEDILSVVRAVLGQAQSLAGVSVVVTAGPTIEALDPVRYLSNASTGKMGYAIAMEAVSRGAEVTLITGPTHLQPISGANMVHIESTLDLLEAVQSAMTPSSILISAAAPADFRPSERLDRKWKKRDGVPQVTLVPNPDVLATIGEQKQGGQVLVGFAAETDNLVEGAREKLRKKNLDMVVANPIGTPDAGFAVDTNRVTLVRADGTEELPLLSKAEVATRILDHAEAIYRRARGE